MGNILDWNEIPPYASLWIIDAAYKSELLCDS
jgi:hypothetical protein